MRWIATALVALLALTNCASVQSRFLQPPGTVSVELGLSGAYLDQLRDWDFPLPINVAMGMKYGLADAVDIGLRIYPVLLLGGILALEPSVAWSWYKGEAFGGLNSSFSVPMDLMFRSGGWDLHPKLGLTHVREAGLFSHYENIELQAGLQEFLSNAPWLHWNAQAGGRYKQPASVVWEGEVGLIRIAEYSQASPLSRLQIGVPTFAFGVLFEPSR